MKLTKSQLKQLIQEEIDTMQQEGLFSRKKTTPSKEDYIKTTYSPGHPDATLEADKLEALNRADEDVLEFLKAAKTLTNKERYERMLKLMNDLGDALIWTASEK
tara:strand:+ start:231 stop:542 length:312 start_codon:yes stop_codon:yes gene_type:complete